MSKPLTEEHKASLLAANRGNQYRKGKPHTAETKARISAALKGNQHLKGKTLSDETRAKMSAAHKGKPSPMTGRKHTEEARAKMRAAHLQRFGPIEEALLRLTRKTRTCWVFEGRVGQEGYGRVGRRAVHRVAYELWVGPLIPGHHIHHLCGNTLCVKPTHLIQLSPEEHRREHAA